MTTNSVYIDGSRVTVAKPGFDAVSLPALDYAYVALDSRLPIESPLEVGILPSFINGGSYYYAQNYAPNIPAIDIIAYINGSGPPRLIWSRGLVIRDSNGTTTYNRTSFYLGLFSDHMQIVDDRVYLASAMFSTVFTGVYYVADRKSVV